MVDISRKENKFGKHPVAVVPNNQIEHLRLMLKHAESPVTIDSISFLLGDKIRITKGKLQGLEGNVYRCDEGNTFIVIRLECLGCGKNENFIRHNRTHLT